MDVRRDDGPTGTGIDGVDGIDARLLEALHDDARLSNAELGRRIGMSAPSVAERVRRLEERGVITGYGAHIDATKLGYALTLSIRVRPLPGGMERTIELLRDCREIVRCDRVSGDDCFVATAHVRDVAHMEALIDRLVKHGTTHSAIVQSAPFVPRLPPLR